MKHRPARKTGYQLTNFIAVLLLLFIVFVSVGYFFMIGEPGRDPRQTELHGELERNLLLWEARRPAAFSYRVVRHCSCTADYRRPYRVDDGDAGPRFAYASPLDGGPAGVDGAPPEPLRIADLFKIIEEAIDDAESIDVSFDPAFGFPTRVDVERSAAADDELGVEVYDFVVVEYWR